MIFSCRPAGSPAVMVMVVGTTGTARDEQTGQIVHSATPAPVCGDCAKQNSQNASIVSPGPCAWRQCSMVDASTVRGADPPRRRLPGSPIQSVAVRNPSPAPRVVRFRRLNGRLSTLRRWNRLRRAANRAVWTVLASPLQPVVEGRGGSYGPRRPFDRRCR